MYDSDNVPAGLDGQLGKPPLRDTETIRAIREILCVHHDEKVLKCLEEVFHQPDTRTNLIHVQEGKPVDLKSVLSTRYHLCFLPTDYQLPDGGFPVLLPVLPANSQVVLITDQQTAVPNPNGQLSAAQHVDFYGFVRTGRLNDDRYLSSFKWVMEQLLNDNPNRILKFLNFSRVEEHIKRRFKRNGADTEDKEAKSVEDVLKYVSREPPCDRIYVPESLRPALDDIKKQALKKPFVLFFKPDSGLYILDL